jgi:hypothetical protein
MILIERLCGVTIPVVSEASESTLTARVDFKFVGVSLLVWLMTLSHCVVFAVTRRKYIKKFTFGSLFNGIGCALAYRFLRSYQSISINIIL